VLCDPLDPGRDVRVALLTNFVPPYRVSLFEAIAARVERLVILTSTEMEPGRPWRFAPGSLEVVVQKTFSWTQAQRQRGFTDDVVVHVPLDTARQLARISPDVIISGELGARSIGAARFGRKRRVPVFLWATLSERSESARGRLRGWARGWLLRGARHVLVNGASGERYVTGFGVPTSRITRVPYTTSMEPFLQLPLERSASDALRVLCVGSLIPRKAPDVLLAAAQAVASRERPIELSYLGDGPLREALATRAARRTPGLDVCFEGSVGYDDLASHYARADVLAFPTLSDEWGLVVNEALAAGVPVLGSPESQAVQEVIVDGSNGWVLEGTTVPAVARGLERVLALPRGERSTMRESARRSSAPLQPAAAAERIVRALSSVLDARVEPPGVERAPQR
jgi:glycosyltransferase involved in cell wall biosynthesis